MLAATLTTVVVFFPVTFLYGVSQSLFSALALAVVISLFAVLFRGHDRDPAVLCPRFCKQRPARRGPAGRRAARVRWMRFTGGFQPGLSTRLLDCYEAAVRGRLRRPGLTVAVLLLLFAASLVHLSAPGRGLLSPHRCRPIHHQSEGAHGHSD